MDKASKDSIWGRFMQHLSMGHSVHEIERMCEAAQTKEFPYAFYNAASSAGFEVGYRLGVEWGRRNPQVKEDSRNEITHAPGKGRP